MFRNPIVNIKLNRHLCSLIDDNQPAMNRNFNGVAPKVLTDMPERIFDLLPRYVEKYGYKDNLFAGKENGQWVKYDGRRFVEITDSISHALLELGVRKGDRIAIVANNCPQWNMVDFAIQQVGAVAIPIYPTVSRNDYDFILHHSETKIIFINGKLLYAKISDIIAQCPSIEHVIAFHPVDGLQSLDELIALGRAKAAPDRLKAIEDSIDTNDVATMIYTSGTMGTPKGVMLSHRNILSDIEFYCPHYLIDETQTALSYLPLSHIYERSVQYSHVYLGVSTYYAESIGTIVNDIADVRPEHFSTVPRLIEKVHSVIMRKGHKMKGLKRTIFFWAMRMAERFDETRRNNGRIYLAKIAIADRLVYRQIKESLGGRLRIIISGGAAIQPRLVKTFAAMGISVVEGYGLTETAPVVCTNSMPTRMIKAGTVGIPCSNQQVKISDEGEILIKGTNVMAGYYKDEQRTREVIDSEGFFHTGDKGRFDEDGMLMITGRIKEIFKTSMGKYVSPALLENKISESPFIGQIMVVGENQKFAAALIVPNFEHLRSWCNIKNIAYTTNEQMVKLPEVIARYRKEIDKFNKFFGDYEQIKKIELLGREWTIEAGEMTASLKLRRMVIQERFKNLIDQIYSE